MGFFNSLVHKSQVGYVDYYDKLLVNIINHNQSLPVAIFD